MVIRPARVVSDDDRLLLDIQARCAPWARFDETFGRFVARAIAWRARQLSATGAEREDALQLVALHILEPRRPRYDSARASAPTYLKWVVMTAMREVTDHRKRVDLDGSSAVDDGTCSDPAISPDTPGSPPQRLEAAQFLDTVLTADDAELRAALEEVADGQSIQETATARGLDRSTLSRRLAALRTRATRAAALALAV
jgi:hypothetical protein